MKTTRKLLVISFFCIALGSLSLIPLVPAQTVIYNGADTERFPYYSICPSEIYEHNITLSYGPSYTIYPETYLKREFSRVTIHFLRFQTSLTKRVYHI